MQPASYSRLQDENGLLWCNPDYKSSNKIIVRESVKNRFSLVDISWIRKTFTSIHTFHEVIDMERNHRMFFDVDAYLVGSDKTLIEDERDVALKIILKSVRECIKSVNKHLTENGSPRIIIQDEDIAILECCRWVANLKYKISFHIILTTVIVNGIGRAKEFASHYPSSPYMPDMGVYTQFHSIRPYNSAKEDYTFKFMTGYNKKLSWIDTLITNVTERDSTYFGIDIEGPISENSSIGYTLNHSQLTTVLNVLMTNIEINMAHFEVTLIKPGYYRLKRKMPSYCPICDRVNEHENMYMTVSRSYDKMNVRLGCYRDTSVVLGPFSTDGDVVGSKCTSMLQFQTVIDTLSRRTGVQISEMVYSGFINMDDFTPLFEQPNPAKVIAVRAGTGTGKTHKIISVIESKLSLTDENWHFIILSYRRTFSRQMEERLSRFDPVNYMKTKGSLYARVLIVQIDSLLRINIEAYRNKNIMIILDEWDGILSHNITLQTKRGLMDSDVLYKLCEMSRFVIVLDAYLRDVHMLPITDHISNKMIKTFNPSMTEEMIEYSIYPHLGTMLNELLSEPTESRIMIVCSTLRDARMIEAAILQGGNIKADEIAVYSSDTGPQRILEDFADINSKLTDKKRIICTPTVSAGIDITIPIDVLYGIIDVTMNHLTASQVMQMLKRSRKCGAYKIYIATSRTSSIECSYASINEMYGMLPTFAISSNSMMACETFGSPELSFHYSLKAAAQATAILSASSFYNEIGQMMCAYGASVLIIEEADPSEYDIIILNCIRDLCDACNVNMASRMAELKDKYEHEITDNDISLYKTMEGYCRAYKIKMEDVTREHIMKYYKRYMRTKYENICRLFAFKYTNDMRMYFDTCIALVMTKSAITVLMQEGINNGRIIALTLILRALGFKSIHDTERGAMPADMELLAAALYTYYRVSCSASQVRIVLKNRKASKWLIKRSRHVLSCFGISLSNQGESIRYIGDFRYVLCGEVTPLRADMFRERFEAVVKGGNVHNDNDPIPLVKINAEKMEELMSPSKTSYELFCTEMEIKIRYIMPKE